MGLADFATRKTDERGSYPGPGQYAAKSCFGDTTRAPTIKPRHEAPLSARAGGAGELVGPGRYDVPAAFPSGPKYVFGCARSELSKTSGETTLGPKYDTKALDMAVNPASPRYSFGPARDDPSAEESGHTGGASPAKRRKAPAPVAQYRVLPSTLDTKATSLGFRTRPTDGMREGQEDVPGPGNYDIPRFGSKVPAPKTIEPHRPGGGSPTRGTDAPGPGTYDVIHGDVMDKCRPRPGLHSSVGTIGTRNFPPAAQPCGLPGPAAYDLPDTWSSSASKKKGVSILTRFPEYHDMDEIYPKPGPGEYTLPSTITTTKGSSFGAKIEEPKRKLIVPGPGAYEPPQYSMATSTLKSPRGVLFNADKTFDDGVKQSPSKMASPRYTCGGAKMQQLLASGGTPPVSTYNPVPVLPKPPGVKLMKPTKLTHRHVEPAPGPGAYDVSDPRITASSKGITFFKSAA